MVVAIIVAFCLILTFAAVFSFMDYVPLIVISVLVYKLATKYLDAKYKDKDKKD